MPFADKNGLAAKRSKLSRDERYRAKSNDGWRWLWRSIQTWLWQEKNQPQGARQHNRLTPAQKRLRKWIYNQTFYAKHKPRLLLQVRETRRMCDDVRERWNGARRIKRKGEKVEL